MQEPEEPLSFRGNGATECEDFVNAVNRYAWKAGKSGDSEWAAHFAMSCLSGKALRWSMELDKNIRSDWDLLSAALLREYREGAGDKESKLRSPAVPTPAAAPTSSTELFRDISARSFVPLSGRIRVDTDRSSIGGYVSRDGDVQGILAICSDPDHAIKVHWSPESHIMRILNPPVTEYNYLGVTHYSDDPIYSLFGPKSTASAALTYATKPDAKGRVASTRRDTKSREPVPGKSRIAVWNVLADLNIIPIVEESGSQYAMIPFVWIVDKTIVVVANCGSYMEKCALTAATGTRAKLVFEPI